MSKKKPVSGVEPELGDLARDKISGFEGIVVARTTWFSGCVRMVLCASKLDKDGKLLQPEAFDIQTLEVVEKGVHAPFTMATTATPGGPQHSEGVALSR